MVIGIEDRGREIDGTVALEWAHKIQLSDRVRIVIARHRDACAKISARRRLVNINNAEQTVSGRPIVANIEQELIRQLLLNVQAPLLGIRELPVCLYPFERLRRQIDIGRSCRRIVHRRTRNGDIANERRVGKKIVFHKPYGRRIVENPEAGADRGLFCPKRVPRNTHTRSNIEELLVGNCPAKRRVLSGDDYSIQRNTGASYDQARGWINLLCLGGIVDCGEKAGIAVFRVKWLAVMREAGSICQREIGMDTVLVLTVKIEGALADFGGNIQFRLAELAHVAQQEAGPLLLKRLISIGICAKEGELPVTGIRACIVLVFLITVITEAVLH